MRQELRAELERALAPVLERLDALVAAAPPVLVDVVEAARRLGKSPATVRAMCARGDLPARRVGRSWRIDLAALRPLSADAIAQLAEDARR